jgi:hypothetical protein
MVGDQIPVRELVGGVGKGMGKRERGEGYLFVGFGGVADDQSRGSDGSRNSRKVEISSGDNLARREGEARMGSFGGRWGSLLGG